MGFEAVFVGSGAGLPTLHGHSGREPQAACIPPTSILTRINLMKAYRDGQQHPDHGTAARSPSSAAATSRWTRRARAKRLGAKEVYIVYRRGMEELPARQEEVEHAEEEGIIFKTLTNPVEMLRQRERRRLRP